MHDSPNKLERYRHACARLKRYLDTNKPESGPEYEELLEEINKAYEALTDEDEDNRLSA